MAAASDAEIPVSATTAPTTVADMPSYPTNTFIRYYPTEGKDEHYTALQLKTGEALQVKSPNKMERTPQKFANMQAWRDSLPGTPDITAFKVTMGAGGATFDLSKTSHLAPLPPMEDRDSDIYCWNRQIVKVLLEFAPDLLENPIFGENYNTIVETLKKYENKKLILAGSSSYVYNSTKLLSASKLTYAYDHQILFTCLPLRFVIYHRHHERLTAGLPSDEEIETVINVIGRALNACIDVIKPRLEPILKAKYKLASATINLSHYNRLSKNNKTKIERLVAHQLWLEKSVLGCESKAEEAKKALSDLMRK
jgi:hypothetical protein